MSSAGSSQREPLHLLTDVAIEQELEQRDEVLVSIALRLVENRTLGINRVLVHGLVSTTIVVRDDDAVDPPRPAPLLFPPFPPYPAPVAALPRRNPWAELTLWLRLLRVGVGFRSRHRHDW